MNTVSLLFRVDVHRPMRIAVLTPDVPEKV